jgi:hypothetical protein
VTSDARWFRLLSRWSLAQVGITLALLVVFIGAVGFDPTVSADRAELIQASRRPEAYRLAMIFDGLSWASIGGTLLIFGALFSRLAPARALFAAACGIGMVTGLLGGTLRLNATSDLAARYAAAAPDQQAVIVNTYLVLAQVITSHFTAGHLLQALGYGLVASMALAAPGFPRWIAVWLALVAIGATVFFLLDTVGVFLFPLLIVYIIFLVIALDLAMARQFWHGPPALAAPGIRD